MSGDAPRQDCVEAQIWGRVPKMSAALKVPKNTVASIILNGRSLEPTRLFLELAPHKIEQYGEKGLGQGGDQEPDGHSDRTAEFLCGDRITFHNDNHLCSTPPIRTFW